MMGRLWSPNASCTTRIQPTRRCFAGVCVGASVPFVAFCVRGGADFWSHPPADHEEAASNDTCSTLSSRGGHRGTRYPFIQGWDIRFVDVRRCTTRSHASYDKDG